MAQLTLAQLAGAKRREGGRTGEQKEGVELSETTLL